jgi:hypothetical protein
VSEALKSCPICGRNPDFGDYAGWEVNCECGLSYIPDNPTEENVKTGWNTRAGE